MKPTIRHFQTEMLKIIAELGVLYDTTDSEDYGTLEAITEHYEEHGRLMIWNGESDNTIFTDPQWNWMFRAWHDYHHVKHQHAFDTEGERAVCNEQINDVLRYVKDPRLAVYMVMILNAEINGQVEYFNKHGVFIKDQREFMKDYVKQTYNVDIEL